MERNLDLNARIRACRSCELGDLRAVRGTLAVPPFAGERYTLGGLAAVAAQPGGWEERSGYPFAGPVSEVIDGILDLAGIDRESLLLANLLACAIPRGEGAQDYPDAYGNCRSFVDEALDYYNPRVVLLMGGIPIQTVFGAKAKVGETRGMSRTTGGRTYIATFHPAVLLRPDHSEQVFEWLVEDWRLAAGRLREINEAT